MDDTNLDILGCATAAVITAVVASVGMLVGEEGALEIAGERGTVLGLVAAVDCRWCCQLWMGGRETRDVGGGGGSVGIELSKRERETRECVGLWW